jgi:hypothetical protein
LKLKIFSINQRGGTDGIRIFVLMTRAIELIERCASGGLINEERMLENQACLLDKTPGHPELDFRKPLTLDF